MSVTCLTHCGRCSPSWELPSPKPPTTATRFPSGKPAEQLASSVRYLFPVLRFSRGRFTTKRDAKYHGLWRYERQLESDHWGCQGALSNQDKLHET